MDKENSLPDAYRLYFDRAICALKENNSWMATESLLLAVGTLLNSAAEYISIAKVRELKIARELYALLNDMEAGKGAECVMEKARLIYLMSTE